MPKVVQIRASYRDDGAFLLRLEGAVLKDDRQTEGWRRETCQMIRGLALRLLEVEKHVRPSKAQVAR
jgi:hypothetical protein